jgi:predicted glycosyltransferase
MDNIPRLDVLLYAHDGRGLGHAGRTIAIGMALRRLEPDLRVLFLSGCSLAQELISSAPLDWLKLPSYETIVDGGRSRGITGKSNFTDTHLGILRAEQIRHIVETFCPRVVLADHSPQGKHRELLPALQLTHRQSGRVKDTLWVLGLRAVIGQVSQVGSPLASSVFKDHYSSLLWYGDSGILGSEQLRTIGEHFGTTPVECGYVSRLNEVMPEKFGFQGDMLAGTVSVPWIGEKTPVFLRNLYTALEKAGDRFGVWMLYLDAAHSRSEEFHTLFRSLPWCRVEEPGQRYVRSLKHSRCAIVYGGYNSLMDVLSLSLPALVILRDMQDSEQQFHLDRLKRLSGTSLTTLEEECEEDRLSQALRSVLEDTRGAPVRIDFDGAGKAAEHLVTLLQRTSSK